MIKVKDINFNIFAFVIKTALVLLSIAVTIVLLLFFEQNGLAVRTVLLRNEAVANPTNVVRVNELFRFNDKEFDRFISGAIPSFIITKTIIFNLCKFITFVYAGVLAIVYVILALTLKNAKVKDVKYAVKGQNVAFSNESNTFNVFNKLNVKLTI